MDKSSNLTIAAQIGMNRLADKIPASLAGILSVELTQPSHAIIISQPNIALAANQVEDLSICKAFWLGPNRILAISDQGQIDADFFGPDAILSDITDGLALFHIRGPGWRAICARGSSIDPAGPVLEIGSCAQLLFAGLRALVHRTAADHMIIQIERPMADFFCQWLTQAVEALAHTDGLMESK